MALIAIKLNIYKFSFEAIKDLSVNFNFNGFLKTTPKAFGRKLFTESPPALICISYKCTAMKNNC
jgi:hypothetical protein